MIRIIILVNLLVYFKALRMGLVSDDIEGAKITKKTKGKIRILRWFICSEPNTQTAHLKNIIVHTTVCVLIYLALGQNIISFITALLFSVNPVNNQCSVWISGRHYAICTGFLLLCFVVPFLSPIFLLLATLNPIVYFAPLGFIGTEHYWIAFLLPLIWLARYKRLAKEVKRRRETEATTYDKELKIKTIIKKLIVAIKIYGYYFTLCIIPFRTAFYHSFMQSGAGAGNEIQKRKALKIDWTFFVGVGLIAYLVYSLNNWTPISWGIWWYSVCITPYLNLFRMQQEIAERYCYLANVGVMYALVNVIIQYV